MGRLVLLILIFLIGPPLSAQEDCNCCSKAQTAFDFWVGEWRVTDSNGKHVGNNTIVKQEAGCVLKENWTSTKAGFTGTSYNFFNMETQQWEQLWVDNTGNHLKLTGNRVNNTMVMTSNSFKHTNDKMYVNRITWTSNADGTVRQLWEVLDDGKVVNTVFDGLYTPKR